MVKIITDSACDLPSAIVEKLEIDVMPLVVYLDDKEYYEGEIESHEFYDAMRNGARTRTAQITAPMFEETFRKYAEKEDDVLYIAFSSGLSGTYQTSEIVKQDIIESYPNFNLEIIDSKAASLGFGLIVYYAAQKAKEGASLKEVMETVNFAKAHMEHIFTVNDLEYLYRGGRVSRGAAVIGSMLNIKPVLDVEDGKLIPFQKVRTRKKAIARLIEVMGERGVNLENQVVAISHGDDLKTAEEMKQKIQEKYNVSRFIINNIGCVIGAHAGPGTLSVFFLNEQA